MTDLEHVLALGGAPLDVRAELGAVRASCGEVSAVGRTEGEARRALVLELLERGEARALELGRALEAARRWLSPELAGGEAARVAPSEPPAPAGPSWRALVVEELEPVPSGAQRLVRVSSRASFAIAQLVIEEPLAWYVLRLEHDGALLAGAWRTLDGSAFGEGAEPLPIHWPTLEPDGPSLFVYVANRTSSPQRFRAVLWGEGSPVELPPEPAVDRFEELLAGAAGA